MNTLLARELRAQRRRASLGPNPRCRRCGEDRIMLLHRHGASVLCYTCISWACGRSGYEQHHIFGRHNDPSTMPVPANLHRLLSERQREWPQETLRNPEAKSHLVLAAGFRAMVDECVEIGGLDQLLPPGLVPLLLCGLQLAAACAEAGNVTTPNTVLVTVALAFIAAAEKRP